MKRQYIFESYDWKINNKPILFQYCPICGTKCILLEKDFLLRPTCPKCGYIYYKNPSPGVSVLIEDKGKVLLGKRSSDSFQPDKWCLPCGFIEYDEDYVSAAKRETKEETNLDVEITSILNVSSNFLSPTLHSLVIVLRAQVISGTLEPGDDIEELQWFPISDSLPEMAFKEDRYLLENLNQLKDEAISFT